MKHLFLALLLILSQFCHSQQAKISNTCNNWLATPSRPSFVDVGEIDLPGNKITVEATFNRTQPYTGGPLYAGDLVSKHESPSDVNYLLRPHSAEITTTNGYYFTSSTCEIELNKTYHVALVYDGTTLKFYRNGFLMSQVPATGNLYQNNWPTRIGYYFSQFVPNTNFFGYINEVRIWNVARTQNDLRSYMNLSLPSPPTQTGLVAYYTFDNLLNKQGNAAYNGTLGGSAMINQTNPNCAFFADSCAGPTQIGNIINEYTEVLAYDPCKNSLIVANAAKYNQGDTVLLIQMKGAVVDSSNTSNFGTILNYNNAGNYEFNIVKNKSGNSLDLLNSLTRQYNIPTGKVQLVRVPYYRSVNVTSSLSCLPWDGSKGGVLAFNVLDSINLSGNIDVSGRGFLPGNAVNQNHPSQYFCFENNYFYPSNVQYLADVKGDGITNLQADKLFGKGALANGGGGGNSHNSGGGGGSNVAAGGLGGYQFDGCVPPPFDNRGIGGRALQYSNAANKIFMGGSGGSGHANNGTFIPTGGAGGGIVIIKAQSLRSNNNKIISSGKDAKPCTGSSSDCHEGMGGGGAGGTILLDIPVFKDNNNAVVTGGAGANMTAGGLGKVGPGGGGGGGLVWVSAASIPASVVVSATGGISGVCTQYANDAWGSTPGLNGSTLPGLSLVTDTVLFKPNIDSVRIKDSATSCNSFNFNGLGYTNTSGIISWQWYFGDGGTASTQNTSYTYAASGTYIIKLVVTDINGCKDSVTRPVNIVVSSSNDFSYSQNVCNPLQVQFNYLGTNAINPFWSFGDGNTSNTQNPTHTFNAYGNYVIKYSNQNSACRDTVFKTLALNVTYDDIIITPDTTICPGAPKQLRSVPSLSFCWSPTTYLNNPLLANPTTSTPQDITYYLNSEVTGNNIIVNGNFESGNTGFTSGYQYATPNVTEGQYYVGPNPQAWNSALSACKDHTTTNGNMMLVNGNTTAGVEVWKQTVTVTPNTNYAFSTWIQALYPPNPAQLQFSINGRDIGTPITATVPTCNWKQFYTTWNSGTNTSATISIVNKNTIVFGNDFAIDDISFAGVFIKRDSVKITVNKPSVKTISDSARCAGSQIQLTTTGATNYSWTPTMGLSNPSISNPIATLTNNITYYVTGTNAFGCVAKDTVNLTSIPAPVITKSNDTTICGGRQVPLFASGGTAYSWSPATGLSDPNVPNPIALPAVTTTYFVTVTNASSCTKTDSVKITVANLPVITKSNDTTVCVGRSAPLFASGGTTYSWTPAATLSNPNIANPVATPLTNTTYYVTVTNATGCSKTDSVKVNVASLPVVIKSNDTAVCRTSTAQLFATGGTSYSWSPAATLNNANIANPVANPTATTTYTVIVTNAAGCAKTDSVKITVNDLPVVTRSNDTTICSSSGVQLFATGGTVYSWTPTATLNNPNISDPVATPIATTTYYVKVTNASGCFKTDSVKITMGNQPVVTKSNDTTFCQGKSVQLYATGGSNYSWSPSSGLSNPNISNPVATPASTTTYKVTVTNASGCSKTDSVKLTINSLPVITKSRDTIVCNNGSVQIFATGGSAYAWTPGGSLSDSAISNPVASPTSSTTYYVNVTNFAGCSKLDSVKISVGAPPVLTTSNDTTVCINAPVQLFVSGAATYSWSPSGTLNNANVPNPIARPTGAITYFVTGVSAAGCSNTDSVKVGVKALPVVRARKSNDITCTTPASQLIASGASTYSWSPSTGLNNPNIANPLATPGISIVYTLTGKDTSGCTNTDSVSVKVNYLGKNSFHIPNSFTPNGDNLNDCFGVRHWIGVTEIELSIFNRFGERVFHTTNPAQCWDGSYRNSPQDANVFVYMIKAKTLCGPVEKKGTIALLR